MPPDSNTAWTGTTTVDTTTTNTGTIPLSARPTGQVFSHPSVHTLRGEFNRISQQRQQQEATLDRNAMLDQMFGPIPKKPEKKETPEEMGITLANKFKLGCDPEFVVIDSEGEIVNVSSQLVGDGTVGWDHGGTVVELRPGPARGTYALLKKLQELIKKDAKRLHQYRWRGGAYYKSLNQTAYLGGHVHLGIEPLQDQIPAARFDGSDPAEWTQKHKDFQLLIQACDRVTKTFEKLDILPTNESFKRRSESGYGNFSDIRTCPNYTGEKRHIEYRSMASWLYDPKTAYLALTAIKQAGVSPADAIALLGVTPSWTRLKRFFEAFAGKDCNSKRAVENVLSMGHKALVSDPEADPKETWEKLGF